MTLMDDESIERLAMRLLDRTLPKLEWTHAGHFAAALWLLRSRRELTSADAFRHIITRYNEAIGTANTDTGGYHHSITLASIAAAAHRLGLHPRDTPLHGVLTALLASPLGKPDWLLVHWRRETLFGIAARRSWVEPDLAPLPFPIP